MLTINDSKRIFGMLMLAYPSWGEQNSSKIDGTLELYHRALQDIDSPLLEAAALQHISMSKWFPSIAELRESALSIVAHDDESPEEAWGEVKKAIRIYSSYHNPKFVNSKIARAVEIMGWRNICLSENEVADRAHFFKVYQSLQNRERHEQIALPEVRAAIAQLAESKRLRALARPAESEG